jgi:hypothetical protein
MCAAYPSVRPLCDFARLPNTYAASMKQFRCKQLHVCSNEKVSQTLNKGKYEIKVMLWTCFLCWDPNVHVIWEFDPHGHSHFIITFSRCSILHWVCISFHSSGIGNIQLPNSHLRRSISTRWGRRWTQSSRVSSLDPAWVGLAITMYTRCLYGIFGRDFITIQPYRAYIYRSGQPYDS